jgi:hypothetical protein
MGRQGPGAQALDPKAAPRQKAAHPLANHPFAANGQHCLPAAHYWRVPRPSSAWAGYENYSLLPYWLLATPYYCLLPTGYWRVPRPSSAWAGYENYSLLATPCCLLTIGGCPVQAPLGRDTRTTLHSLLATPYYCLLPTPYSLLLPTPYCLLAGAPSKLRLGGIRELLPTPY